MRRELEKYEPEIKEMPKVFNIEIQEQDKSLIDNIKHIRNKILKIKQENDRNNK